MVRKMLILVSWFVARLLVKVSRFFKWSATKSFRMLVPHYELQQSGSAVRLSCIPSGTTSGGADVPFLCLIPRLDANALVVRPGARRPMVLKGCVSCSTTRPLVVAKD